MLMLTFYHSHSPDETLRELHTSTEGLSHAEASARVRTHGHNRISHSHTHHQPPRLMDDAYL